MTAVSTLLGTVLSVTNPFDNGRVNQTNPLAQSVATALTPPKADENAINIAYSFSPAASLSLLSQPSASLLLSVQASAFSPASSTHFSLLNAPAASGAGYDSYNAAAFDDNASSPLFSSPSSLNSFA